MPLLPKQPDVFPGDLLASLDGAPWWVAHVRSRQEKLLARHLIERDIGFFLPQSEREITSSGRRRRSYLPLFPGYVFFRAERPSLADVWRSNIVANIIEVEDQKRLHEELAQLWSLLESGGSLVLYEDLVPGDPVRIKEGPFTGYSGVLVRQKNTERLIVMVSLIRKAVAVEFSREVVGLAPGAERVRRGIR
ncbi:MAG: transcription termination/antitermination NusG family protein [Thermoanaerobaculia bacterium]